jgi:hypothetical protein
MKVSGNAQIRAASPGGEGGAPGVSGMNRTQGKRSFNEKWPNSGNP